MKTISKKRFSYSRPGWLPSWSAIFKGEHFTDALRTTLCILLPVCIFFYMGEPDIAVNVGVGALLIALTDMPAHRSHKLSGAIINCVVFGFTALLMSLTLVNVWLAGLVFSVFTFLFSLLAVFGQRLAVTGTMGIILAVFVIGLRPAAPLEFTAYVFIGGLWYYLLSVIQSVIWPYRPLKQAIADCMETTSLLLKTKVKSYDPNFDITDCYKENIRLHEKVSEKQEQVRNLLLSDATILKAGNMEQKYLFNTGVHLIDLYEQIMAIHYDYKAIRKQLEPTGALEIIREMISLQAWSLSKLADWFRSSSLKTLPGNVRQHFYKLKTELNLIKQHTNTANSQTIEKLLTNLEAIDEHIEILQVGRERMEETDKRWLPDPGPYSSFVAAPRFSWKTLRSHLALHDPSFRFALRLSVMCLFAYVLSVAFPPGKYSYWVLLTIVVVARPRLSMTWKRNQERLLGTGLGILLGLLILGITKNVALLLTFAALFLFGFFLFNRIKYTLSVFCITPMAIICLSIYQGHWESIVTERIYYTLLGCAIVLPAAYLFPIWETRKLKQQLHLAVEKNFRYLEVVAGILSGQANAAALRLARKNAYLALADFSTALSSVRIEPQSGALDVKRLEIVQVLCYRINALIGSLSIMGPGSRLTHLQLDIPLSDLRTAAEKLEDFELNFSGSVPAGKPEVLAHTTTESDLLLALSAELKYHLSGRN